MAPRFMYKDKKHCFVPFAIDGSTKGKYSDVQIIVVLVCLGIMICGVAGAVGYIGFGEADTYRKIVVSLLVLVLAVYAPLLGIRRALGEKKYKSIYKIKKTNEVNDFSLYFDIFNMRERKQFYYDGRVAMVVGCEFGYAVNRPGGYADVHRRAVCNFQRFLLTRGYEIHYYNLTTSIPNMQGLVKTEQELREMGNDKLYALGKQMLSYTRMVSREAVQVEMEYYVVSSKNIQAVDDIEQNICDALRELSTSIYIRAEVLEGLPLEQFYRDFFHVKYLDVNALLRKRLGEHGNHWLEVGDPVYAAAPPLEDRPAQDAAADDRIDGDDEFQRMLRAYEGVEDDGDNFVIE